MWVKFSSSFSLWKECRLITDFFLLCREVLNKKEYLPSFPNTQTLPGTMGNHHLLVCIDSHMFFVGIHMSLFTLVGKGNLHAISQFAAVAVWCWPRWCINFPTALGSKVVHVSFQKRWKTRETDNAGPRKKISQPKSKVWSKLRSSGHRSQCN